MNDISTTIGAFNADTRQVEVTFAMNGVTHTRNVNAILNAKGKYDRDATAAMMPDVARGVAHKIARGVITNPTAPTDLPTVESPGMPGMEPA